jgi:hypothetical protein
MPMSKQSSGIGGIPLGEEGVNFNVVHAPTVRGGARLPSNDMDGVHRVVTLQLMMARS